LFTCVRQFGADPSRGRSLASTSGKCHFHSHLSSSLTVDSHTQPQKAECGAHHPSSLLTHTSNTILHLLRKTCLHHPFYTTSISINSAYVTQCSLPSDLLLTQESTAATHPTHPSNLILDRRRASHLHQLLYAQATFVCPSTRDISLPQPVSLPFFADPT
jgi:hypothetical protein